MTDDAGNNSFRGRGLFAKYVFSLVGLVLFVLAINSAIETYFIYRETQASLVNAMAEKADTTASRIQQFMEEVERQISWVTRASSTTLEQRRADYLLLLRQVPAVSQVFQIDGNGREQLRMNRATVSVGSGEDFSGATGFSESVSKGLWYGEPFFRDNQPFMTIGVAHPRRETGVSVAEINLRFLSDFVTSGQAGKVGTAYIVSPKGELLASSDTSQTRGADLSYLPQVAALIGTTPQNRSTGTGANGAAVLVAAKAIPDLKWFVLYEQPLRQALLPIKDLLIRAGGLVALGLLLAMIAGTVLTRRMLVPIRALHAGARRLAAGNFGQHIEIKTRDELEELAEQFNHMADEMRESYTRLEHKVAERTADLAQSVRELKVLEEVGRAVASSLDLKAVLSTVATRAAEITGADAVVIYGHNAEKRTFELAESIGLTAHGPTEHLVIDEAGSVLGQAAASGQPIDISDIADAPEHPLNAVAADAGFNSVLVVPLADQQGVLGSLIVLRKATGAWAASTIGLMQTFAHQSVLAMRNARLFHEVDQKGRELSLAHDTVQKQAAKLQEQTVQLKDWNKSLEERVAAQLAEIGRISKLERFLAPQVAQLIASSDGHEALLASHRGEVTVVFCDLRGFTAFTESAEPEEVMNVLREYHVALGELIFRYEGTLDRYAGDGVMVLFNAPIPLPDHAKRAVCMAVEMRDAVGKLTQKWRSRGHTLGFGIGIAVGYATLGQIGFDRRLEYAAVGSVTNLASRLCDEAKAGQIIVSQRTYGMVEEWADAAPIDDLNLKGFARPVPAVEILAWREGSKDTISPAVAGAAS
ncbi:adenylate/guanylate cyclase domain-containing protein [Bradyrhizobium sp. LHD-71]|uniref:adenylate/guanylate cyclase domain-containing protein n=1 Tax=Bradyrhizobium sp. LHD-71 TaxID=3072141 RepID=UPI00281050C6|nr:adenylate/guanylate cyclase domain-containing protein [Bradyrhizobium sp. LHD-71]MDQ8727127.1 adenylate/guanylate cyclase domain-containing protein [Bradyrhizobium sp. LHD-71]